MRTTLSLCLWITLVWPLSTVAAQKTIWIEGETPSRKPAALKDGRPGWKAAGWGRTEIISGAKILHVNVSDRDVAGQLP